MPRPTKEELEKKVWYRFSKVFFNLIILILFSLTLIYTYATYDNTVIRNEYYYVTCEDNSFHKIDKRLILGGATPSLPKPVYIACGRENIGVDYIYKMDLKIEHEEVLLAIIYSAAAFLFSSFGALLFLVGLRKIFFYIAFGEKINKNLSFLRDSRDKTVINSKSQSWSVRHYKLVGSTIIICIVGGFLLLIIFSVE